MKFRLELLRQVCVCRYQRPALSLTLTIQHYTLPGLFPSASSFYYGNNWQLRHFTLQFCARIDDKVPIILMLMQEPPSMLPNYLHITKLFI